MKILVISDTHGRNDDIEGVLEQVGEIDMLIHCGDVERGEKYIRSLLDCPIYMVSGNNDYNLDLPAKESIEVMGHRIMVVHGHRHMIHRGIGMIRKTAIDQGYDIVMFGHTHCPFIHFEEEVTILNPGSLSYPRQSDRKPTFLLMEIDEDGEVHYGHGYYGSKFSELQL